MGFKKYKWHKIAAGPDGIQWSRGNVAEVQVDGKTFCIGRFQDQWYGFSHLCPHAGAPMIDGYIDGACRVVCPVHSIKFNLKDGRDANGDGYKLKTYPVEVRADGVYFGVEEGGLFKWF
jgi:3-phenylpropionate/trans-cinnamate dioxygenase ferredoxin subunit